MKKISLFLLIVSLLLNSCILYQNSFDYSDYYTFLSSSDTDIEIKENKNNSSNTVYRIPKGKHFFSTKQYSIRKRSVVEYNGYIGYTKSKNIQRIKPVNLSDYNDVPFFDDKIGHYVIKYSFSDKTKDNKKYNIKYYDFISKKFIGSYYKSGSGNINYNGTVNVKGYYRKDGTYVRPHTRSSPNRR